MPDSHCVVTQDDGLPGDSNFRQLIPTPEHAVQATEVRVVVAFNHVDVAAGNTLSVQNGLIDSAEAEVSEKIKNVVLADLAVEIGENGRVHILR